MILLACNAGYGNTDLSTLPKAAVDLDGGWVTYARPKTGAPRRAKLWGETIQTIRSVLAKRRDDGPTVFITQTGNHSKSCCTNWRQFDRRGPGQRSELPQRFVDPLVDLIPETEGSFEFVLLESRDPLEQLRPRVLVDDLLPFQEGVDIVGIPLGFPEDR